MYFYILSSYAQFPGSFQEFKITYDIIFALYGVFVYCSISAMALL